MNLPSKIVIPFLISFHCIIGTIVYEQIVTGDIVQGLPKVEEILEGRKPKDNAILATQPGIVTLLENDNGYNFTKIRVLTNSKTNKGFYRKTNNEYQTYKNTYFL